MDTYNLIGKRTHSEDVLSIVESCFMPVGIETDHYAVIGNITAYRETANTFTNESVYLLDIECNDLLFTIAINKKDLLENRLREEDLKEIYGSRVILSYDPDFRNLSLCDL